MARNRHYGRLIEDLEIISAGAEGKSIGRWNDKVVFVNYGAPGDVADVKVIGRKRKYLIGEIVNLKKRSKLRTEPKCAHFGLCGGCKWQHLTYEAQLKLKAQQVTDSFQRIGKLNFPEPGAILGSEETFQYRNKIEYTFSASRWILQEEADKGDALDKDAVGFHIPGRYDKVLHIDTCHLQSEPTNAVRKWFYDAAKERNLSFYNIREHQGLLRNLILRNTIDGQWMIIVIFGEEDQGRAELLDAFCEDFPEIGNVLYVINTKQNDTIYDLDVEVHKGQDHIIETIGDRKFKIRAKSFFQTNPRQAKTLYDVTKEFANVQKGEVLYDLYCGTGTIGLYLSENAGKIVGVESVEQAIQDAYENARMNGVENAAFEVGDMRKVFDSGFIEKHGAPHVIVTDPPRSGMHKDVVDQINQSGADRVVYVSCNVATQARDLDLMRDDYRIVKVQPVDMFPHTHHVENVVLLQKI